MAYTDGLMHEVVATLRSTPATAPATAPAASAPTPSHGTTMDMWRLRNSLLAKAAEGAPLLRRPRHRDVL